MFTFSVPYLILVISQWISISSSVSLLKTSSLNNFDSDVAQILSLKDYLPNENDLPKSSITNNIDNDATYILSKLPDEDLLKLLNQQPEKQEYSLNDIIKIFSKTNGNKELINTPQSVSDKHVPPKAYFKLEHKEVDPYVKNTNANSKYNAFQKINNVLYSRPQDYNSEENGEDKEIIFNALVAQLKALCCKVNKPRIKNINSLKSLVKKMMGQKNAIESLLQKSGNSGSFVQKPDSVREHIFLIVNDEITTNPSQDLVAVDPDTLSENSTVLILGPITTPLSENQLKLVMGRIANELSKSEYLPMLQKISEGSLDDNVGIMKSILSGPSSRRYIKPHRCNHQSKLAKVYGGPKWLICTGYLNINTPSLYD